MTGLGREGEERRVRVVSIVMTAGIPLGAAFLVWNIGLDVQPHRIGKACIFAAAWAVFNAAITWLLYRAWMKGIRERYARPDMSQALD